MILTTLACTLSSTGISRPAYSDIYETLREKFKSIYGSDAYIEPDSQDGQLLATFAKALDDSNAQTVAVYNSFSPATSQGDALSKNVKINGIARAVATKSTIPLRVTGSVGTVISSGIVSDAARQRWMLPASVIIPAAGFIDVTGTAEIAGALEAATGTATNIETPTLGWQSVTNTGPAVVGAPVETDAALRKRQAVSVALPSKSILSGIVGAVSAVAGVTQVRAYENDTNVTDANGIPAHHIALVVQGGVNADIANAVVRKKGPGCGTHGTTSLTVNDPGGIPTLIKWYAPTQKRVIAAITIKALTGYLSTIGDQLKAAVAAYVSGLGIGKRVDLGRLYVPAQLTFGVGSETYEVDAIQIAFFGNALAAADLAIAFNELANLTVADITLTVT